MNKWEYLHAKPVFCRAYNLMANEGQNEKIFHNYFWFRITFFIFTYRISFLISFGNFGFHSMGKLDLDLEYRVVNMLIVTINFNH